MVTETLAGSSHFKEGFAAQLLGSAISRCLSSQILQDLPQLQTATQLGSHFPGSLCAGVWGPATSAQHGMNGWYLFSGCLPGQPRLHQAYLVIWLLLPKSCFLPFLSQAFIPNRCLVLHSLSQHLFRVSKEQWCRTPLGVCV